MKRRGRLRTMSEVIVKIEPTEVGSDFGREAGFKITTTQQEILLVIGDDSSCCEQWGYFLTEDDADKFIGSELRGVSITDTDRSRKPWNPDDTYGVHGPDDLDYGDVLFVDIETDRGVLQFVAYNSHNGYYGHQARVVSAQLSHEKVL